MSSIFYDIDKYKNSQTLDKLKREINGVLNDEEKKTKTDFINKLEKKNTSKIDEFNDMYSMYDKIQYRQQWRQLNENQKKIKLLEYDKNLDDSLIKIICVVSKGVKYDPIQEKIVSINYNVFKL